MPKFLENFDALAGIAQEKTSIIWLERTAFLFLMIMILAEPHSIAATQSAWLIGMLAWLIRMFIAPRPKLIKTPLTLAFLVFFGWSLVTAIFSYAPDISLDRLRGVAVLLIFFFVLNNLRTGRAAIFLVGALLFSAMIPVVWTPIERLIGRGVEVQNLSADNFLTHGKLTHGTPIQNGDTIFAVGRKKVRSPEAIIEEIEKNETSEVIYYRPDYDSTVEFNRADLPSGTDALTRLGFGAWKHSHNWRSEGTYGHYTTFAEVLQLVCSLIIGLLLAALFFESENSSFAAQFRNLKSKIFTRRVVFLTIAAGLTALALLLTVTRASQLGLIVSALAMVFVAANRKFLLILAAIILPVALVGVYFQQQSRHVGYFDSSDDSTKSRVLFYQKGFDLWTANAKNLTLGIGMDASKRFVKEWNLYDFDGTPMGHFHSTPLQLLVERGIPALLIWLWIIWLYGRTLLRGIRDSKFKIQDSEFKTQDSGLGTQDSKLTNWIIYGILLGCFGGLVGFFTGGIVHYNLGDSEVAMLFYMLMGISIGLMENGKWKMENVKNN